jgi:hypothetical protein
MHVLLTIWTVCESALLATVVSVVPFKALTDSTAYVTES